MPAIREILHPTDFSTGAAQAFEMAIDVARRFEAHLTILHVSAPPVYIGHFGDGYGMSTEQLAMLKADQDRYLDQFRARALEAGVPCTTVSIEGFANEAIVEQAAARNIDLIVLGTHGRTGLGRLLLGSVAERVLRAAKCPVLTVRHPTA